MKVMIVDDESIVLRALEKAFTKKGHEVQVQTQGDDGLEALSSDRFDAAILDVVMPGLTGPQVIEEYNGRKSSWTPVFILMTAYTDLRERKQIEQLNVAAFINKPFDDIFKFVENVERLVAEKHGAK